MSTLDIFEAKGVKEGLKKALRRESKLERQML